MPNKKEEKIAVAIKYVNTDLAPKVIASGKGYIAENIIDKAIEENVRTYRDDKLANNLININIGDEIPEDLYFAVAEILAFVYDLDEKVEAKNNE